MRDPLRIRRRQQIRHRMIAEVEPGAVDGSVDDGETVDAFFLQSFGQLGHGRYLTPAKRAVKTPEQTDEHWLLATKLGDGYLALTRNGIEHHIWRPISGTQGSFGLWLFPHVLSSLGNA